MEQTTLHDGQHVWAALGSQNTCGICMYRAATPQCPLNLFGASAVTCLELQLGGGGNGVCHGHCSARAPSRFSTAHHLFLAIQKSTHQSTNPPRKEMESFWICVRLNFSFWLGAKTEGGGPGEAELAHPASGRALGHRCGATLQSQSRGAERLRSCARASAFAAAAARWDAKSSPDGATAARCSEGPC